MTMSTTLKEGQTYRLPDGTEVLCTQVIYGVKSPDHSVMACEVAPMAKVEPCGFSLESADKRVLLSVHADGSIAQRTGIELEESEETQRSVWRYGDWEKTDVTIDDLEPATES